MDLVRKKKLDHAKNTSMAIKKEEQTQNTQSDDEQKTSRAEEFKSLPYSSVLLEWEAPEYQYIHKNENWYLWLGIVAAIFITIAIFLKAYIVAATFFLIAIVVVMYAQKTPDSSDVKLTNTGIVLNNEFFKYQDLELFWIFYNPPHVTTLTFRRKDHLRPDVVIEIHDEDPVKIREILLEYVVEDEEKEEDFIDTIARRLKF